MTVEARCEPAELGAGPTPWLDNALAQTQLDEVGALVDQVDGIVEQAVDAANRQVVVLYDPSRITRADVELHVIDALRRGIQVRQEWMVEHAQWLEEVHRGGGGLTPEEREVLLQPTQGQPTPPPSRPLAVAVREACGDPQQLAVVDEELRTRAWLEHAGSLPPVGMGWVTDHARGVVKVRVNEDDAALARRVKALLERLYGEHVEVTIGPSVEQLAAGSLTLDRAT
ncbi:MAG TPA: hypothetical protein VGA36_05945 [Nitriliruptorales bacterium]